MRQSTGGNAVVFFPLRQMGVSEAVIGKAYLSGHRDPESKHLLRALLISAGLLCKFDIEDQYSKDRVTNGVFHVVAQTCFRHSLESPVPPLLRWYFAHDLPLVRFKYIYLQLMLFFFLEKTVYPK